MPKDSQDEEPGAADKKDRSYKSTPRRGDSEVMVTTKTTTVPDPSTTLETSREPSNAATAPFSAATPKSSKAQASDKRPEGSATAEEQVRQNRSGNKASAKAKLKKAHAKAKSTSEKTKSSTGGKNAPAAPLPTLVDQQRQSRDSTSGVDLARGQSKMGPEKASKQLLQGPKTGATIPGSVASPSAVTSGLASPYSEPWSTQPRVTSEGNIASPSCVTSPGLSLPTTGRWTSIGRSAGTLAPPLSPTRHGHLWAQTKIASPGHLAPTVSSPKVTPGPLITTGGKPKPGSATDASPVSRAFKEAAAILCMSPLRLTSINKGNPLTKLLVTVFATAVVAVVVVIVVVLAMAGHDYRIRENHCETEGCLLHSRLLTEKLNKTIDPCDDFSAYVCSAWSRSGDYREQVKTPVDGILYYRFVGFRKMLADGVEKLSVGVKAWAMHDTCMRSDTKTNSSFEEFRSLMESMGLSWPEPPEKDVDALGVMISLAFKWRITIWITVSGKATATRDAYWRLGIAPGAHVPLLRNQHASVTGSGGYTEYWNGYYYALRTSASQPLDEATIERIAGAEGDILDRLMKSLAPKGKNPAVLPIADVGNFTAPLSSSKWLEQLNQNLDLEPRLTRNDSVHVSDTAFLAALGDIFARYSDGQLVSHLSWLFVQTYAPIADRKLHLARFGDREKADLYKPIFCAFHVESTLKMLVLALNYVSRFTQADREKVTAHLGRLSLAGVRELNASTWLDEESKTAALEKLASVRVALWPKELWLGNEFLKTLYNDFPTKEDSFGDYWIKAHMAIAKKNRSEHLEAALSLPSNFPPPAYHYDYVDNNIDVPIGIVERPLYYKDGTMAMFYGGLGFLIALEMVKALDRVGLRWSTDGRKTDSILTEASTKAFEEKDACLQHEGRDSIFPDVPAVEMAYAAMADAIREDKNALSIRNLPEERVFFMTLCFMMCTAPDAYRLARADCHKVVRNSPSFHKVFRCAEGSKMNPTEKCSFFHNDTIESPTEQPAASS